MCIWRCSCLTTPKPVGTFGVGVGSRFSCGVGMGSGGFHYSARNYTPCKGSATAMRARQVFGDACSLRTCCCCRPDGARARLQRLHRRRAAGRRRGAGALLRGAEPLRGAGDGLPHGGGGAQHDAGLGRGARRPPVRPPQPRCGAVCRCCFVLCCGGPPSGESGSCLRLVLAFCAALHTHRLC